MQATAGRWETAHSLFFCLYPPHLICFAPAPARTPTPHTEQKEGGLRWARALPPNSRGGGWFLSPSLPLTPFQRLGLFAEGNRPLPSPREPAPSPSG